MNYEYFEGYESIPFKPEASGKCHLPTAWWLAEISLLAYEHPGFVKWVLRHIKASHLRYFSWDTTQLITFILNEYCIVAFRGTEIKSPKSFHDIISDMNINMTDFYGMGRVHQGFKLAFDETLDPKNNLFSHIDSLLQSGLAKKVIFTGHSMGGSLAT
ncbi:MAG: hypothetical protein D6B26_05005, partial [Spirochaetaceae bacterium]